MEEKRYFITTTGLGPVEVTSRVKEQGYKVIGRAKLWNPHPISLTDADMDTIISTLPEWVEKNYGNIDWDLIKISKQELERKLRYEFTLLHMYKYIEVDIYVLKIENKGSKKNIYIGKGSVVNKNLDGVDYVINYYTTEWHEEYANPTLYEPGDFW